MRNVNADDVKTLAAASNLTIVDCWAPWCGPCRMLTPRLEGLSRDEEFAGVNFVALNVDDNAEFARERGIRSIPTLLFYKGGEIVHTMTGVPNEKVLAAKITEHK